MCQARKPVILPYEHLEMGDLADYPDKSLYLYNDPLASDCIYAVSAAGVHLLQVDWLRQFRSDVIQDALAKMKSEAADHEAGERQETVVVPLMASTKSGYRRLPSDGLVLLCVAFVLSCLARVLPCRALPCPALCCVVLHCIAG